MLTAVAFWTPKAGNRVDEWEDHFALDEAGGRFAVADGASSSPRAAAWAAELARGFIDDPFDIAERDALRPWLDRRNERFNDAHPATDRDEMTPENWYAVAASEAFGYATLLGVSLSPVDDGVVARVVGVGDAVALLIRDGRLVGAVPDIGPDGFGSYPDLVSSDPARTDAAVDAAFRAETPVFEGDEILLMTDAIAEWALSRTTTEPDVWDVLGEVDSHTFTQLVADLRAAEEIVNDDVTVVRCRVES